MKTTMRKDLAVLLALVALCIPEDAFAKEKEKTEKDHVEKDKIEKKEETKKETDEDVLDDSGVSFGVRAGYALPMGSVAKDAMLGAGKDLSKNVSGMIPIGADLGYRITPNWYIGATFTYGFVNSSGDVCKRIVGAAPGCSASGSNVRIGATIRYTFSPQAKIAPWIGIGTAYEVLSGSVTGPNWSTDSTVKGFEYFNVQIGGDYRILTHATVGPMIGFSLGQYNSYDFSASDGRSLDGDLNQTALHHWLTLGVQGKYDL